MPQLSDYEPIVGRQAVEELRLLARPLAGRSVLNVNSTAVGGGVAEILSRMVPLLNELGLDVQWEVIKGGEAFYTVTKKIHNALHGATQSFNSKDYEIFKEVQEANLSQMRLDHDIIFIHDPQPVGLIRKRKEGLQNKWVWRCHVDVSCADTEVWTFLKNYVEEYNKAVFSSPIFSREIAIPQALVCPSIDPLSEKNRPLSQEEMDAILQRLNIPLDKPLVTQVSRFDRLKDPVGVIEAFRQVQDQVEARLLLVGGPADDDPEGAEVLLEVRQAAEENKDIIVLVLPPTSHLEINAIQRASTIILQKSLREGFGLTITEALWKGKPVIAGAVGGIPLQIVHKYSGILTHSIEGTAYWIKQLLQQPTLARKLGENGREEVRSNFLLTRHLRDYLLLFLSLYYEGEAINLAS